MLELPELKQMLFRHLQHRLRKKFGIMITRLNSVIIGFMKAQLLVSFIILAVTFVGLLTHRSEICSNNVAHHLDHRYNSNSRFDNYSCSLGTLPLHKR